MVLYERCIGKLAQILPVQEMRPVAFPNLAWKDAGKNQLIFQDDTAYELGAEGDSGVSGILYTTDEAQVPEDEVVLLGPDLQEITADHAYGRIVWVRLKDEGLEEKDRLYQLLRAVEYRRYHVNPEGFMMRISSMNHRESVRVSKQALQGGITFGDVGKMMVDSYHVLPQVAAVKILFITDEKVLNTAVRQTLADAEAITKTLDKLVNEVNMDCDHCGLQEICEEVQKLSEKGA